MAAKVLIVVRHAHRHKLLGRDRDNGLSKKGRAQALRVAGHYEKIYGSRVALLLSSPKTRCLETLAPLAEFLGAKTEVLAWLDEQSGSDKAFERQIRKFCRWWKMKAPPLTVCCSHGDFIPRCLEALTGVRTDLRKGGWAEVEMKDGKPALTWLLQEISESASG